MIFQPEPEPPRDWRDVLDLMCALENTTGRVVVVERPEFFGASQTLLLRGYALPVRRRLLQVTPAGWAEWAVQQALLDESEWPAERWPVHGQLNVSPPVGPAERWPEARARGIPPAP